MVLSIEDVNKGFFKYFMGRKFNTPITLPNGTKIPGYVSQRSAKNFGQAKPEQYPAFALTPLMPVPSDKSDNDVFNYEYIGNELTDSSSKKLTEEELADENIIKHLPVFYRPFLFDFKYDVHFVFKDFMDRDSARLLMLQTFGSRGVLEFDGYEVYKLYNDEPVKIKERFFYFVEHTEIPRPDGVLQDVYTFTLEVWISSGDPQILPIVNELNIVLTPKIKIDA